MGTSKKQNMSVKWFISFLTLIVYVNGSPFHFFKNTINEFNLLANMQNLLLCTEPKCYLNDNICKYGLAYRGDGCRTCKCAAPTSKDKLNEDLMEHYHTILQHVQRNLQTHYGTDSHKIDAHISRFVLAILTNDIDSVNDLMTSKDSKQFEHMLNIIGKYIPNVQKIIGFEIQPNKNVLTKDQIKLYEMSTGMIEGIKKMFMELEKIKKMLYDIKLKVEYLVKEGKDKKLIEKLKKEYTIYHEKEMMIVKNIELHIEKLEVHTKAMIKSVDSKIKEFKMILDKLNKEKDKGDGKHREMVRKEIKEYQMELDKAWAYWKKFNEEMKMFEKWMDILKKYSQDEKVTEQKANMTKQQLEELKKKEAIKKEEMMKKEAMKKAAMTKQQLEELKKKEEAMKKEAMKKDAMTKQQLEEQKKKEATMKKEEVMKKEEAMKKASMTKSLKPENEEEETTKMISELNQTTSNLEKEILALIEKELEYERQNKYNPSKCGGSNESDIEIRYLKVFDDAGNVKAIEIVMIKDKDGPKICSCDDPDGPDHDHRHKHHSTNRYIYIGVGSGCAVVILFAMVFLILRSCARKKQLVIQQQVNPPTYSENTKPGLYPNVAVTKKDMVPPEYASAVTSEKGDF